MFYKSCECLTYNYILASNIFLVLDLGLRVLLWTYINLLQNIHKAEIRRVDLRLLTINASIL